MAVEDSISGSDGSPESNSVYIETSLGTNLITVVSSDETFSDLRERLLREHVECFPRTGEIKIHGFKVERNGKFYRFLESMLVRNAFHGVTEGWVVLVDAEAVAVADQSNRRSSDLLTPVVMKSVPFDRLCVRIPWEESNVKTSAHRRHIKKSKHAQEPECGRSGSQHETEKPHSLTRNDVIDRPRTKPFPIANGGGATVVQRSTVVQSEPTTELQKVAEVSNAKSKKDDPKSEPSAKKRKREKKAAKTSNQKAAVSHSEMQIDSSDLGETPASTFASGQLNKDIIMSSKPDVPGAICQKDELGEPAQEINLRPSSLENGMRNKESGYVEGGQNDGSEEHQNHVSVQNNRVHEGEFSQEIPPKTPSSEKHGISAQDDLQSKAKEGIAGSKVLEASETMDPPKLSKKKKKSKKTKDPASVTPPTSATKHVKGFVSNISPTKPQNGKDTDTISTSFLATDKEINDVIQNVVESHLMVKGTTAENDQGVQSAEVAQKLESDNTKRCPEAVISGSPSRSGRANEVTDNVEVSCQNSGINFNDYFVPKTDGANDMGKAKKGMKKGMKKEHAAHSDGPSSDLKTPLMLDAKLNKEPLEVSDRRAKPPVSTKSHEFNSVLEETLQSNDAKPTGTVNDSNSKKDESNTESSENIPSLGTSVNEHQSLEGHNHKIGREASLITKGEVVNCSKKENSLVGVLGAIVNDGGDDASSNVDDNSDASTRTPSDASWSSDYSDGESNADSNSLQNGSCSSKREERSRKPKIPSGMTLDRILRSSSTFKKAKLTASQLLLEDPEGLFIPENLAQK
ncbi:COP1-interacting protein-related [Euphorbia peplus]|nr:COP1-interacting protein-related [Euphorbia peplus]